LKFLNTQPKTLPNDEETRRKRRLLAETLEADESRIKRFIRISLIHLGIFHSDEEIKERTAEVFQQTASRALEKVENFDTNRSANSWLNGFAANIIKQTQSRVLNRRAKYEDGFEDFERIETLRRKIETTALPEEVFWEKFERDENERFRFEQLISKLKTDYQKILRLHYFEELNIIEIAARLGKTEGAAQRQLNRAETKLREILGAERERK
jgi:RNA polymerase sigma factor (sigma-70 family)